MPGKPPLKLKLCNNTHSTRQRRFTLVPGWDENIQNIINPSSRDEVTMGMRLAQWAPATSEIDEGVFRTPGAGQYGRGFKGLPY